MRCGYEIPKNIEVNLVSGEKYILSSEKISLLIEAAFVALKNSYSPYSSFSVGASVLTREGKIYKGTNIENSSFGLTNCAERTAIFSAYTDGKVKKDIIALAVVSEDDKLTTPCGACRQVLSELIGKDIPIILSNGKEIEFTNIDELLPNSFTL